MAIPQLQLSSRGSKRIGNGHPWIYSNEVDNGETPLKSLDQGTVVEIQSNHKKPLGLAMVSPGSLLCAKMLTRRCDVNIDQAFWQGRITRAAELRKRLGSARFGRQIFAEADGLPGIIVDAFDDVLIGQLTAQGTDARRRDIEAAISEVYPERQLVWRNDFGAREHEGLAREVITNGKLPAQLIVREAELEFVVRFEHAQKTGWFYDQRANRDILAATRPRGRVLDLFAYRGAWAMRALAAGASDAIAVDSSAPAIEDIRSSADRNGFASRLTAVRADAFDFLKNAAKSKERYDVVIVDPPAFAKKRKDIPAAKRAYRALNELALRVVAPGGLLVSCSCSFHLHEEVLLEALAGAARHVDRSLRLLSRLQQSPDHPVHPAVPETRYLKGFLAAVDQAR